MRPLEAKNLGATVKSGARTRGGQPLATKIYVLLQYCGLIATYIWSSNPWYKGRLMSDMSCICVVNYSCSRAPHTGQEIRRPNALLALWLQVWPNGFKVSKQ